MLGELNLNKDLAVELLLETEQFLEMQRNAKKPMQNEISEA
jgi:hypothetical protein